MNIARKISYAFIVLLFLCCTIVPALASEFGDVVIIEEIDLPCDLNFYVSEKCSEHAYFMQATARDDGYFAIYSRHVPTQEYSDETFKKVYIDLYNTDGVFLYEISFTTTLDLAVELTEFALNIYFYSSVLSYDLDTKQLHHYAVAEGAPVSSGLYNTLRSETFQSGEWEYRCKKAFNGYTQLIRIKDGHEYVVVDMPGGNSTFYQTFVHPVIIAAVLCVIIFWYHKRKKKGQGADSVVS